jgi:dienelactone hydrolase
MMRSILPAVLACTLFPFTFAAMATELPDPFLFNDGRRVKSAEEWRARRMELLELIQQDEYGHLPPAPKNISIVPIVSHRMKSFDVMHRQFKLICDPGEGHESVSFVVDLLIPNGDGPFPVILRGDWCWGKTPDDITRAILARGYILAEFNRVEIAPDTGPTDSNPTAKTVGLYAAYPHADFGAIAAWAWGYCRCIDLLITLPYVDKEKIAITGHSRGGKAVLLAGAADERIALTAPNCSGCCGAGCFRFQGPQSETLANITQSFPYWFAPRLKEFVGHENDLPFDQHCVKALCAPRALLTSEALDDLHANPSGTYQTHLAAREVYKFVGKPERIAIHFRPGVHEHNADDFGVLLDFADQVFFGKSPARQRDWNANPFPDLVPAFTWKAP